MQRCVPCRAPTFIPAANAGKVSLPANKQTRHSLSTTATSKASLDSIRQQQKRPSIDASGTVAPTERDQTVGSRHLLRHLLRECTYLPDSHARQWIKWYILERFRTYGFKVWHHRDDPDYDDRIRRKLREAHHGVALLKRANEGERRPLLKVLLMAYGRTGRRRRQLMRPLLAAAPPDDGHVEPAISRFDDDMDESNSMDEATSRCGTRSGSSRPPGATEVNRGAWTAYAPDLTPTMRALLRSQIQTPPPHLTRQVLRRVQPRLEELNAWQRPMPLKRVKNQTREWYADLLEKVHPPLPRVEWERLRDLASGKVKENVPVRRAPAQRSTALETIVMFGKPNIKQSVSNRDAHRVTPRYMQRLWVQVFAQCPMMEYDAISKQWSVTWGEQALHRGSASFQERGKPPRPVTRLSDPKVETATASG